VPGIAPIRVALVTGASGFLGRVLCARLTDSGVRVLALMRRSVEGPWNEILATDLGESAPAAGALRGVDTVFHLAGKAHALEELVADEAAYRRVNIQGTQRLVEAAAQAGVRRVVFFSSVKAMGEGGPGCLDESTVEAPETPYGRSKLEAEHLVLASGKKHGMHVVNLRLTPVYGPDGKGNVSNMLRAVASGRFPPLPNMDNKRSMVHVSDVAEAALLAACSERAAGQTYILTDGRAYSTRELYVLMREAVGKPVPRWSVPEAAFRSLARLGDSLGRLRGRRVGFDSDALRKLTSSAWYSAAKITMELGYKPSQDLRRALPEMVAYLQQGGSR
jgi:UDP-glucose 4-epimerase